MKSNVKNAALAAIIGTSYFFVLRLAGTFFVDFFRNLTVARATAIVALPAMGAFLVFFVTFYNEFVERKQSTLGQIARLMIICYVVETLLLIRRILLLFNIHFLPSLMQSYFYVPMIQWLVSLIFLAFFIILYRETISAELHRFRTPAIAAIVSSAIGAIMHSITLLHYRSLQSAHRYFIIPSDKMFYFLPLVVFAFVAMFYFFISFYRFAAPLEGNSSS